MSDKGIKLIPKLRFPGFNGSNDWQLKRLEDVSQILRGGSPRPIDEFITTDIDGLNWLKIGDVDQDAKYVTHTREKVLVTALSKTREVNPGDLIMSNSMSFGRPYILKIKSCIHDGWIAVTKIDELTSRDFLYYFILSPDSQKYFLNYSAGSGVQNLNADIIKLLPLALPGYTEQQKVADCLSSVDELITAEEMRLDTLKSNKKGLMQQLFPLKGKVIPSLRFPEFRDAGEWRMKSFDKLFTVGNGRDYKHLLTGEVPVYGSGGYMLSVNDFLYDGESVCIGRKGTINNPIFLTGKFWTVDTLFYTHSFKECLPKFIYLIFQNINWLDHNEAGGIPSLAKANILKIEVAVPGLGEQKKIVDCLSSIDFLISSQTEKVDLLKAHKRGLLQQLFPVHDEDAS